MLSLPIKHGIAVAALCSLTACAGFRGGWESMAYIGEAPPPPAESRTPFEARQRSELKSPGLSFNATINNRQQSYDIQVYLFVLPLSVDLRTRNAEHVEPGKTRVTLRITPAGPDFVFRPQRAILWAAGRKVAGAAAFEFGRWDRAGNRVTEGGEWRHRPIAEELSLIEPGRSYVLSIDFPIQPPSPKTHDITVDLSQALQSPKQPLVPLIRFLPVRWREGYT